MDKADGVRILDFHQAEARARGLAKAHAEREAAAEANGPPLTVCLFIDEYAAEREGRWVPHGGFKHDARRRLAKHVDKALLDALVADLTVDRLQTWRKSNDERVAHDFRAALNAGLRRYREKLPSSSRPA
jgi:hypothetical protein